MAMPALRTTKCQYLVANPVRTPETLNSRVKTESNLVLQDQLNSRLQNSDDDDDN